MAYKLRENEDDGLGSQKRVQSNPVGILLTPKGGIGVEDLSSAFSNMENYGRYISNLRNKAEINKAVEDYFGPSVPMKRRALEKQRGKPFPIKTKQAIDDLIRQISSKSSLLKYEIEGNSIYFPYKSNISPNITNIIKEVMKNAGISPEQYKITIKTDIQETIKKYVKEAIQRA